MIIIGIETSCDETSISLLQNGKILSNVISSQIKDHIIFGGVVPEIASRLHVKNLTYVLQRAVTIANISIKDIDYIAYTSKPGLIGALHIGKIAAETLGLYLNKPVIPVNHLYGHIYSGNIDNNFNYPLISLLVSGGHTQLVFLSSSLNFEILGSTLDDAVGECYDKVARILGLNYPGGPEIDKLSQQGHAGNYQFPMPLNDQSYNFSFSGLKSAAANLVNKYQLTNINIPNFCCDFQYTIVELLLKKIKLAIKNYQPKMIVLAGGVAANSLLRKKFLELASDNLQVVIPKLEYCTDNGAMIARVAWEQVLFKKNNEKGMDK